MRAQLVEVIKTLNDISLYGLEKMGVYLSQYRGWVADNKDPKGYGRLQLSVPDIYGDSVYEYWAWPVSNFSGIGYGCQVLPQVNDLVWVKFERGNPRRPLWMHGHFGKDEKPDNLKDPNNYWFKTPGGILVELDDTTKEVRITHSDKETNVRIGTGFIEMQAKGALISIDDAGVSIDSGDSNVFIGGQKQVLYSLIPNATEILDVSQIGVSQKTKVGA